MKYILPLLVFPLSFLLTSCSQKTDIEKGYECIEEQKKKFGENYRDGDAAPCIEKYWMPSETNPYLKEGQQ